MWPAVAAIDPLALLRSSPRRQLYRWDASAFPTEQAPDAGDANPLSGSEWCEQLVLVQRLSAGAYGFVWCCLDRDNGSHIAIKFIARDKNTIDKNVEREIINHSMLMHPHIIEFKICFLTERYLAIAMEYAEGEDLLRHALHFRLLTSVYGKHPLNYAVCAPSG